MSLWRNISTGVRTLLHRADTERDLEDELRHYYSSAVDAYVSSGLSPVDAARRVRTEMGSMEAAKDVVRGGHWEALVDGVVRDVGYAFRTLRRAPVFTVVAILTLALGIGSSTAVFSAAASVLLRGLPYRESGRLMTVYESSDDGHQRVPSFPTFADWQAQGASLVGAIDGLAFVRGSGITLPGRDGPEQFIASYVSPGFFTVMGTQALLGRTFLPDDEKRGAPAVAVISHDFFVQHYGGDPATLGQVLDVDSVPTTIIGVMPRGFAYPNFAGSGWLPPALWEPLSVYEAQNNKLQLRGLHSDSRTVIRLGTGADSARGVAVLRTIERRLAELYPEDQAHWNSVELQPIRDELFGDTRPALILLSVAIVLVLLLACANVTNLLLARGSARTRELAVRTALGASRWRIARQLLTETLVLATAAGTLGLLLASALVGIVRHAAVGRFPFATEIRIDRPVALFAVAVTLGVALLVGVLPALRAGRGHVVERLRGGATGAIGGVSERRLRSALVSVQFAFALTLLIGAGLLLQSFRRLEAVPLGYDSQNLISFTIGLPEHKYDRPAQAAALYREILDATRALPTVEFSAAAGGALLSTKVGLEGWPTDRPPPRALYHPVSTDYLRTLKVRMIDGRWFSDDDMRSPVGFVVNEQMAKVMAPNASAIGMRITVYRSSQDRADFGQPITMPVVGIVADIHEYDRATKPEPEVFLPYTLEVWPWMNFVVRAPDAARVVPAVIRVVHDVDPAIRFRGQPSVEERAFAGFSAPPFLTTALSGFAACALLLAAVGLYGIVAYGVAQRTREMGVRIALGATERHIISLVIREGIVFVLVGATIGLLGALASTRLLTTMLFETKATDTGTYAGVLILLVVVAFAASYLPARRAAKTDPMLSIRAE